MDDCLIPILIIIVSVAEQDIKLEQQEQTFNDLTLMTYSYVDPEPIGICFVGHGFHLFYSCVLTYIFRSM